MMSGLTDSAKEEYSRYMQFRFRFASAIINLGYVLMPTEFYDDLQRVELEEMAENLGLAVKDKDTEGVSEGAEANE